MSEGHAILLAIACAAPGLAFLAWAMLRSGRPRYAAGGLVEFEATAPGLAAREDLLRSVCRVTVVAGSMRRPMLKATEFFNACALQVQMLADKLHRAKQDGACSYCAGDWDSWECHCEEFAAAPSADYGVLVSPGRAKCARCGFTRPCGCRTRLA